MNELLDAALEYGRRPWLIFPVHSARNGVCMCARGKECDRPGKHPRTKNGLLDASTDLETIRRWWTRWPDANIAVRCGKESGIVVLDVDPRNGGDASLAALLAQYGPLPESPLVRTGGGGTHHYYAHPGGLAPKAKGFRPGLDFQGDGAYVIVPPSLHASGGTYAWVHRPDAVGLPLVPAWLLKSATSPPPAPPVPGAPVPSEFVDPATGKVAYGKRRDLLCRIAKGLAYQDLDEGAIYQTLRATQAAMWPPQRPEDADYDKGARYVAKWATRREQQRRARRSSPTVGPNPRLEAFDPEAGELFAGTREDGRTEVGIAFVVGDRICRTTVRAEFDRIDREFPVSDSKEKKELHDLKVRQLQRSLPFTDARDALWPLPGDPTLESVSEWERRKGTTLCLELERYFSARIVTHDANGHVLLACWTLGASARSPKIDFAPRLMFEAPFGWGKSTAAEAVQLVVPRAVYGASLTPAAVQRMMNENHPVLLVDESAIVDNAELLRVLRAGFKRGTKIVRAAQNSDRGVVPVDPFGWVILTTQVDTREDLVSRCYVLHLTLGEPTQRVTIRDPEAADLRTVLTRFRLEIAAGLAYPDIEELANGARTSDGLEPRSRDKLTALWPFAKHYGVEDRLVAAAGRLEEDATEQLAASDKGLVVAAIRGLVEQAGGPERLKAQDLELTNIHPRVEALLVEQGEAAEIPIGHGETIQRLDPRRYGPRDFTGKIVREIGFKVKTARGRSRLDLKSFLTLWPRVNSRYGGNPTLDEQEERGGQKTPPTLPQRPPSPSGVGPQNDPTTTPPPPHHDPYTFGGGVGIRAPDPEGAPSDSSSSNSAGADSNRGIQRASPAEGEDRERLAQKLKELRSLEKRGEKDPDVLEVKHRLWGRALHTNCEICVSIEHHLCWTCSACSWQENHGDERPEVGT